MMEPLLLFGNLWLLLLASWMDLRTREVHPVISYSLILFNVTASFMYGFNGIISAVLVFLVCWVLFQFDILGGGDVKLLTAMGAVFYEPKAMMLFTLLNIGAYMLLAFVLHSSWNTEPTVKQVPYAPVILTTFLLTTAGEMIR